jgi:rubrerythrin
MEHLSKVLELLEGLEERIGDLYQWFAELFADDDEARALFERLSKDEDGHANIVRFQRRMLMKNKGLHRQVDVDLEQIKELMTKIARAREDDPPSLEDALILASRLEADACEYHYRSLFDPETDMGRMVLSLGRSDQQHLEILQDVLVSRGYLAPVIKTIKPPKQPKSTSIPRK